MRGSQTEASNVAIDLAVAIVRLRARLRLESPAAGGEWTWPQLSALSRVIDEGPCTVSDLALAEHLRPQSMASIVAALKSGKLVTAKPDPSDGRKSLISATAKGRAIVAKLEELREEWLAHAIETAITPKELLELRKAVALINRLAESQGGPQQHFAGW